MTARILSRVATHIGAALYVLALLALALVCAGHASADGGQNAQGVADAVTAAAPALLSGQWLSGGIVLALGLLHVLALQSQHWQSQKTIAGLVQSVNSMVTALQQSTPVSIPAGSVQVQPTAPAPAKT